MVDNFNETVFSEHNRAPAHMHPHFFLCVCGNMHKPDVSSSQKKSQNEGGELGMKSHPYLSSYLIAVERANDYQFSSVM